MYYNSSKFSLVYICGAFIFALELLKLILLYFSFLMAAEHCIGYVKSTHSEICGSGFRCLLQFCTAL